MLVDGYLSGQRHADPSADDGPHCPHCGARNDPEYRYCRRCVGRID